MAEEEDKISTLPDEILCHILSFLETKQADATCIFSKRWKHLWRSVPSLYFSAKITNQNSNIDFNDLVYSVLLSRDAALPIKSFHLHVEDYHPRRCPIKSITKWLNFVVQRRLENLYLNVESLRMPNLPISILNCKTLVVLKVFGYFNVEGLSSVLLPSLKTLHLTTICFAKLRDFMLFLIGCPLLEDFLTLSVSFDFDKRFGSEEIFVFDESLTCNEWKSFFSSKLVRADVDCSSYYFPLKAVYNVQTLRLEFDQGYYHDDMIPTFHNLTTLKLICYDYSLQFLLDVLNHCPKLQRLDFDEIDVDKDVRDKKDDKLNWIFPDVVPQCLSLHLRTCNLFSFVGLYGDLMLARYILKNARVLQTMNICNIGKPEIKRMLSSFPRASSRCQLTVNHVSFSL